jgi:[ribosomal protein S5]-alanine N-acetyltransferase
MDIEKIYGNLPTLETERLLLRKITLDDVEGMFSYASNDEVTKYVTWDTHRSLADTKQYIEFVLSRYENKQIAPWGIESKETKEFIGTIDFVWWQPAHQKAEIGYVISDKYWGKGIATEASKKLIQFGFEEMDLVRIQAICFVENAASARVLEKVGMTFEGILRKAMFVKGKHRDLKLYSIIKRVGTDQLPQ